MTAGQATARSQPRLTLRRRQTLWGIAFCTPAVLFFLGLFAYPLLYTVYLSFHNWDLLSPPTWAGLANYRNILQSSSFWHSVLTTLYYVAGTCVPIIVFALPIAALFNHWFRLRQLTLTVFFIPVVVSLTAWTILWDLGLNPSYGFLTIVTDHLGFQYIPWLGSPHLAMPAMILLSFWKGLPYYTVILLAGMRTIPADFYEAARVDGAGPVRIFFRITLPLLRPVLLYVVVIAVLIAFQVFVPAYILTNGGPGTATTVLPLYIYDTAFTDLKMGLAATASVLMLVLMLGVTALQIRLLRSAET